MIMIKKMFFWAWLIVFFPGIAFSQDRVEIPVWNLGDKWEFGDRGTIEVMNVEKSGYVVGFSKNTCIIESQGFQKIIFNKTDLHRIQWITQDKSKKYTMGLRKIFDFPYTVGKQWIDSYSALPLVGKRRGPDVLDYTEKYKILGWDDISVRGGKFKALKMEVSRGNAAVMHVHGFIPPSEYKGVYWYSPDVRYFVKCEYDPAEIKEYQGEVVNWELTSFQLKK